MPELQNAPLAGSVAVITGGSRGLGLAIAELLGHAGALVVIGALPGDGVGSAVRQLRARGVEAHGLEVDVSDRAQVEALAALAQSFGDLDIWINNAGTSGVYGPVERLDPVVFERVINVNVRGVFHGTQIAIQAMRARSDQSRRGDIVNVWGKGAEQPVPLQAAYATSKAWNAMFTKTVRRELADTSIRVHGFDPGLVRTEMISHVTVAEGYDEKVRALPVVVALWGQTPTVAARPVLKLVAGRRRDHRALALPRAMARAAASVVNGDLRKDRRIALTLTVVPDDLLPSESMSTSRASEN